MIRIVRGPTWAVAGGCILALSGCDLSGSEPARLPIQLGFYIGVTPANRPAFVDIGRQRETLREQGVEPSSDLVRWLPVSDIKNWIEDPSERGAVETDAASYFRLNWGLVGARRGEEYYILVHTAPDSRMAYSTEGPWGVEDLALSTDNLGRPSIVIELDAAGAKRMHELTAPHVGEPLAIVAKEHVYSAPILQSPLGKYVMITGGFVEDEVRRLHDQLRESLLGSSPRQ